MDNLYPGTPDCPWTASYKFDVPPVEPEKDKPLSPLIYPRVLAIKKEEAVFKKSILDKVVK